MKIADVLASLKKRTLDKTDLDEKIVSGVKSGLNTVKQAASNWYQNTDLNKTMPGVQSPKAGFEKVTKDPSRLFVLSPSTLDSAAKYGEKITPKVENPWLRGVTAAATELIKTPKMGFETINQGVKEKSPTKMVLGALQTSRPAIAFAKGGAKDALMSGAFSAIINGMVKKAGGGDFASEAGKGFVEGVNTSAITRFTNPVVDKAVKYVAPSAGLLARQAAQRTVGGLGNIVEDEIIAKFNNLKTTANDTALSFLIGAAASGNSDLLKGISAKIKTLTNGAEITPKNAKRIVEEVDQYIRDSKGRFSKNVKNTTAELGKYTPDIRVMAGGEKIDFNAPSRWIESPTGLKRIRLAKSRLQPQEMMGAVAGIETYQDENGETKVRYNPKKGLIALGLMAGEKARGYKDAKSVFSNLTDKKIRFEIDDSNAKIKLSGPLEAFGEQIKKAEKEFDLPRVKATVERLQSALEHNQFRLGDLLDHSELYKNYPDIADIKVTLDSTRKAGSGSFNPQTNTITISGNPFSQKDLFLHEVQHAIQQIEGFASGGNPNNMAASNSVLLQTYENEFNQIEKQLSRVTDSKKSIELENRLMELDGKISSLKNAGLGAYKRLAGEVEARDVEERMNLSPEQRASTQPLVSQNIPLKDQIVDFSNNESSSINDKNPKPTDIYDISPDLKRRLNALLNSRDALIKEFGYSIDQADTISAKDASYIIENKILPKTWFGKGFEADMVRENAPSVTAFREREEIAKASKGTVVNPQLDENAQGQAEMIAFSRGEYGNGNALEKLSFAINSLLSPLKNQTPDVQEATKAWDTARKVARVEANTVNDEFQQLTKSLNLTPDEEWKLVQFSQTPSGSTALELGIDAPLLEKAKTLLKKHRDLNDQIYQEALDSGIDLNYLNNHIYQAWKENQQEINNITAKGLAKKPGFAKKRGIDSFQEGLELGLTPKFSTFGQFNALATEALQKAKANKAYSDLLIKSGQILPASEAPADWIEINAKYFPKAAVDTPSGVQVVPYKAPPQMGKFVNNLFGGQPKEVGSVIMSYLGGFSQKLQDIKLSSGLRGLNSFTLGTMFRDMAAGVGDIVTGNPIRGAKTATAGVGPLLRTFLPGDLSGKFERENVGVIKEMAQNGIGYSGKLNFNSTGPKIQFKTPTIFDRAENLAQGAKGVWNWLFNSPTFEEMMWQRKVNLFKAFKESFSEDMPAEVASKQAAQMLANYDGVVEDLGRSEDVKNALSAVLFAPRYREAIIGSQLNILKGFANFKDPTYSMSRKLGVGLVLTYMLYDYLNQQFNDGRHLIQNPATRAFELMIPRADGKAGDYYSIPFMPGYTATPRRIYSGVTALMSGDSKEAMKQFSGLTSSGIQTMSEVITGKDYFGRDIYDETKPLLPQQAKHLVVSNLPGWPREAINYIDQKKQGKNPNAKISLARAFELPIKQGNSGNDWYFQAQDKFIKSLPKEDQEVYQKVYGKPSNPPTNTVEKKKQDMLEAQMLLNNPSVLEVRKQIILDQAEKTKQPVDPFFLLSPVQQQVVLNRKAQAPGSEIADKLTSQNINWLKQYWQASEEYYDKLKAIGVFDKQPTDLPGPTLKTDDKVFALQETYFSLPKGTGDRTAFLESHPELKQYWDNKRDYENQMRISMGLPALDEFGGFGSYEKKLTIGKPKKIAFKKPKLVKLKQGKIKINIPKITFKKQSAKKLAKVKKVDPLKLLRFSSGVNKLKTA